MYGRTVEIYRKGRRIRGEKRTVGGVSINLVGTQKQRVYIINPINRKVNYMHSKRSFPSRSKLRDLLFV